MYKTKYQIFAGLSFPQITTFLPLFISNFIPNGCMVTGMVTDADTCSFPCLFSNPSLNKHNYTVDYKPTNRETSLKTT